MSAKREITSYKDLLIWQKGLDLCDLVYDQLRKLPVEERFALGDQIRRSVVSFPSNIAEGYSRQSKLEYIRFLRIAFASLAELETQILICQRRKYFKTEGILKLITELLKMTNSLISKLSKFN